MAGWWCVDRRDTPVGVRGRGQRDRTKLSCGGLGQWVRSKSGWTGRGIRSGQTEETRCTRISGVGSRRQRLRSARQDFSAEEEELQAQENWTGHTQFVVQCLNCHDCSRCFISSAVAWFITSVTRIPVSSGMSGKDSFSQN